MFWQIILFSIDFVLFNLSMEMFEKISPFHFFLRGGKPLIVSIFKGQISILFFHPILFYVLLNFMIKILHILYKFVWNRILLGLIGRIFLQCWKIHFVAFRTHNCFLWVPSFRGSPIVFDLLASSFHRWKDLRCIFLSSFFRSHR